MGTTQQLLARYGNPVTDPKAFTAKWTTLFVFPPWMAAIFPPYLGKPVTRQYVNKDVVAPLTAVFHELLTTGLCKELKTFDGCWNIRNQRNSTVPSVHSWALAFDFNAALNAMGRAPYQPGMFSRAFLDVWRRNGFTCGADFQAPRFDAMHFEYVKAAK